MQLILQDDIFHKFRNIHSLCHYHFYFTRRAFISRCTVFRYTARPYWLSSGSLQCSAHFKRNSLIFKFPLVLVQTARVSVSSTGLRPGIYFYASVKITHRNRALSQMMVSIIVSLASDFLIYRRSNFPILSKTDLRCLGSLEAHFTGVKDLISSFFVKLVQKI